MVAAVVAVAIGGEDVRKSVILGLSRLEGEELKYLVWLCGEGRDVVLSVVCTLLHFTFFLNNIWHF